MTFSPLLRKRGSTTASFQFPSRVRFKTKRFIHSKFNSDPTRVQVTELEDGYNFYAPKIKIWRLMQAEGIPYTFIPCNFFMRVLLPSLVHPGLKAPPKDKVTIFGDGNTKAIFMEESDVAAFTINAVDSETN